jgi:hypothetical protein
MRTSRVPSWASMVAVCFVGLTLSACSSSTPGVLTQSDIPSYLGLTANPSASATAVRQEGTERHCKTAGVAVFTLPGWTMPKTGSIESMARSGSSPIVVSVDDSCASPSDARMAFKSDVGGMGPRIVGIGDEATLLDFSAGQRTYGVEWRKGNQIGVAFVVGPTKDKRIRPALVELLAHRAAANLG